MFIPLLLIAGMEAGHLADVTHQAMDIGALVPQLAGVVQEIVGAQLTHDG